MDIDSSPGREPTPPRSPRVSRTTIATSLAAATTLVIHRSVTVGETLLIVACYGFGFALTGLLLRVLRRVTRAEFPFHIAGAYVLWLAGCAEEHRDWRANAKVLSRAVAVVSVAVVYFTTRHLDNGWASYTDLGAMLRMFAAAIVLYAVTWGLFVDTLPTPAELADFIPHPNRTRQRLATIAHGLGAGLLGAMLLAADPITPIRIVTAASTATLYVPVVAFVPVVLLALIVLIVATGSAASDGIQHHLAATDAVRRSRRRLGEVDDA